MGQKKQHGTLHHVHTRIPEKEYQKIKNLCDKLGITQAQFYNTVIQEDGYEQLLFFAKKINREPRPCRLELTDEAAEEIERLTCALNDSTSQLRHIGYNLSALIRDIRSGAVPGDRQSTQALESMKTIVDAAIAESHSNGTRLAALLYDEDAISKIETIWKNCWGEVAHREVKPCTHG